MNRNYSATVHSLKPLRIGIDTHQEPVVYLRSESHVCRSEGLEALSRISLSVDGRTLIATLNVVHDHLLDEDTIGLSEAAWRVLQPAPGSRVRISHAPTVESMSAVRAKIYGHRLSEAQLHSIIRDVVAGRYSDVELSAFITACGTENLDNDEVAGLTRAMIDAGERLSWPGTAIYDKHCVGGLPGNRTTPLLVAICAANGMTIPKTSSRAITSPAGTADTMETLAPVNLSLDAMRAVVEREGGCVVWGGAVHLSPADDILIRVERALDIDSEGQMVASVLSKKAAAGSTHVVIDIPVGPTAKVRTRHDATHLSEIMHLTGRAVGMDVRSVITDGRQPVGRGIGPALEAHDILAILQGKPDAPADLADRASELAGALLELAGRAAAGEGRQLALTTLRNGKAWQKFQAICTAQGGMRTPPVAPLTHPVLSPRSGRVIDIDNRKLSRAAKLAGAPIAPSAGLTLEKHLDDSVKAGEPLFVLHAEAPGELEYTLEYLEANPHIFQIES
ncbi:MAG TPA: thymidine phosphorylase family protein [Gammaproteobacteria bacterium]